MKQSYAHVVLTNGSGSQVNQSAHLTQNQGNTPIEDTRNHLIDPYASISIDSNQHPLFLHNNDHPGLVLISKKLIGTENFGPWKRSMQIALNAKINWLL